LTLLIFGELANEFLRRDDENRLVSILFLLPVFSLLELLAVGVILRGAGLPVPFRFKLLALGLTVIFVDGLLLLTTGACRFSTGSLLVRFVFVFLLAAVIIGACGFACGFGFGEEFAGFGRWPVNLVLDHVFRLLFAGFGVPTAAFVCVVGVLMTLFGATVFGLALATGEGLDGRRATLTGAREIVLPLRFLLRSFLPLYFELPFIWPIVRNSCPREVSSYSFSRMRSIIFMLTPK